MNRPVLGCIADDLTGATDLGNNLVRAGMRVRLTIDVPDHDSPVDADAVVVALKSRTISPEQAVTQSIHACRWLRTQGVEQIYFKICSTFDSTPKGNIGPVIEALMDELHCDFTCVVPAFPDNRRTVYQGHLFVGETLLSESNMRNHPLTPMTDANLVRFLQLQLDPEKQRRTGLIDLQSVADSADTIVRRINRLRAEGVSIAVADAAINDDLQNLATALRRAPLLTASSGLGIALPAEWGFHPTRKSSALPPAKGLSAILSGSCSSATNAQVHHFIQSGGGAFAIDFTRLVEDSQAHIESILTWADTYWKNNPTEPLLIYSTADTAVVEATQRTFGVQRSGEIIEIALGRIAAAFVSRGVGQLLVAGGETSGTCIRALSIDQMQIGPQIDPGVPWCYASSPHSPLEGIHLALKSGNFGKSDFFTNAFSLLR